MDIKTCEFVPNEKKKEERKQSFFHKLKPHLELIAALLSGAIVLLAWIYKDSIPHSLFVILHITAFIIGGFAKAKEGIEDTIKYKELNVELLMIFAAIGSAMIGYWTEGAVLIFIFALSGALETYTLNKSNKEISSLMDLQPEEATVIIDGNEKVVPASELQVGDIVLVRASERIPADGVIIRGSSSVDEQAITGESIPVQRQVNEEVYASTVALDGTIMMEITKPASETLFQKIINMVQSAQDEKSPSQLFIERFEGTYVKVVLIVVAVMMFLPYLLFGWSLSESIYRAMVLLVVASPCALVASIMPATLSAISNSAKHGVLFKGGVHIENLSQIKAIAFDKTGTLTNGKPVVTDAYYADGTDEDKVLATIAAIEEESTHPLANAIKAYGREALERHNPPIDDMRTVSGKGVTAVVDGVTWKVGNIDFAGKELVNQFHGGIAGKLASEGKTIVCALAGDTIVAVFALKDTIRDNTKDAIQMLKNKGIHPVMLTGDNELTAKVIADEAGIDHYIANCLPEEKVHHVKDLKEKHGNVAMVGDGINDAPALATANTGIAMGEGTDVALETADVVLMKNDLEKITNTIDLSKRMNRIVKQNIVFSLSVIVVLIVSNFLQVIDLPLGVVGHEGSTILVILNGLRLLRS